MKYENVILKKQGKARCFSCKIIKPLTYDYWYKGNKWGLFHSRCKDCSRKYWKKYKATPKYKEYENQRRKDFSNPKVRARKLLTNAVYTGKIKRGNCVICGKKNGHGHHTDYSKPLEVMWLCQKHHTEEHKN